MQHDVLKFLLDAREACEHVLRFSAGKTLADYLGDVFLRSAIERQLMIVGEAVNQAAKLDAAIKNTIADFKTIVAFRNVLVHGYSVVENSTVWGIVRLKIPSLLTQLREATKDADANCG